MERYMRSTEDFEAEGRIDKAMLLCTWSAWHSLNRTYLIIAQPVIINSIERMRAFGLRTVDDERQRGQLPPIDVNSTNLNQAKDSPSAIFVSKSNFAAV